MQSNKSVFCTTITRASIAAVAAMTMLAAGAANAQLPLPTSTAFDITGQLQKATLDPACATNAHCGGTITVQGQTIIVPKETIVLYPANATTWQETFALAPAPYGLTAVQATGEVGASGLALNDLPVPLANYEAHVIGNRVLGGPAGADVSIAGLVYITSHSLNMGAGFINFIDYTRGEIRVGGTINDPNCAQGGTSLTNPLCSGARVQINDPLGRFGRASTVDARFSIDEENPTIMAGSGFPMCLPRAPPAAAGAAETDPLCPQSQRPIHADPAAPGGIAFDAVVNTNDPTNPAFVGVPPRADTQVPLEVGDYVTFSGIVVQDTLTPTAGPWPLNGFAGTYVSAWGITDNVAVYTFPGTNPAYIMSDAQILGTGGLTVLGLGEAAFRTRFEGMTTDVGRSVHLYAVDFSPITGAISDREYGTIGVDPGAPNGAVKGRWRFRPPCLAFGTVPGKPEKDCVMNAANTFLPPPREMRSVIEGAWVPGQTTTAANGIIYGQYHAPIFEYIFPENVPGSPIVPNNFNTVPFLTDGGYTTSGGTIVHQLNPWPDTVIPPSGCTVPSVDTGGPYTVPAGGTVQLNGSSTGTTPITFLWTVSSGSLSASNIANPVFNAIGATSP